MQAGQKVVVCGRGNVHHITWVNAAVPRGVFQHIAGWVSSQNDYSAGSIDNFKSINGMLKNVNAKYKSNVNTGQLVSIRNIVLKDKIIKGYYRMNSIIRRVSEEYADGEGILVLSFKYDFPPLNLLRGIFLQEYPSDLVYEVFSRSADPSKILTGRDLEQYMIAESHDAESVFNQALIAQVAAENEVTFVGYFTSLGIKLQTQDDLAAEQVAMYGRAVITPDILFTDEVIINGTRCHWIDYKDYIGTNIAFLHKSNSEQAAKYNKKWGPGAMCYHRSFVDDVKFPDTMLLDAASLPISLRELKCQNIM